MMRSVSSPIAVSMTIGTSDWRAQPAGKVQPALARQHQVEHHQVVVAVAEGAARLPGVAHRGDAHVVLLFQEAGEQVADLAIIVHHQDVRRLLHDAVTYGGSRRRGRAVCIPSQFVATATHRR